MPPEIAVFHPKTADTITFAVDGSCTTTSHGPAAGYGIYVDHHPYSASICEPLPASNRQESQTAEVKGLLSALELVLAMRPRSATLVSDSQYAVNGYNHWMSSWRNNGWQKGDGGALANKGLWECIIEYPSNFTNRCMRVDVVWLPRNSTEELVNADLLAKQACSLSHYCNVCLSYIGRKGTSHNCRPVCNTGSCESRQFCDIDAYNEHHDDAHSMSRPCRRSDCDLVFGSEKAGLSHERMAHNCYVFDCEYCDSVFQDDDVRLEHEMDECDYAPYCRSCNRWFCSLHAKEQHSDAVHRYSY